MFRIQDFQWIATMVKHMCLVTYIFGPVLTSLTVCVLITVDSYFCGSDMASICFCDNSLQFGRCLVLLRLPFLSYTFAVSFHLAPFPFPPHLYLGCLPFFPAWRRVALQWGQLRFILGWSRCPPWTHVLTAFNCLVAVLMCPAHTSRTGGTGCLRI